MSKDDLAEFVNSFQVAPGKKVKLQDFDPRGKPYKDKDTAEKHLLEDIQAINSLQDRLFAEQKCALLVVLQGIDTSGKDGTIRAVFNVTGPLGVVVASFKAPSAEELAHDYLWRIHQVAPRRGFIGIFNRSHYEDVLVVKVKKFVDAQFIDHRYDQINAFEKHLSENRTVILKFMLNISSDEQKQRLQERVDNPEKQWKFNPADLEDRKLWDDYQEAYETMLNRCSTEWAPWHVIPSDRNWARNSAVARIVRAKLEQLNPQYPRPDWDPASIKIS